MGVKWSKEECLEALRTVASRTNGEVLSSKRYERLRDREHPYWKTIARRCGGWKAAKDEIELEENRSKYSRRDIIESFEEAVDDLGEGITSHEYVYWAADNEAPNLSTIVRVFGSFNGIKHKLGYKVNRLGDSANRERKIYHNQVKFCMDCIHLKCKKEPEDCQYYQAYKNGETYYG